MLIEIMRKPPQPFRWLLTAIGIWLVLSPFVLFSKEAMSRGASDREILTFMAIGIGVLVLSGVSARNHTFVQVTCVLAIGAFLIYAPMLLGYFGNAVAVINAWLSGMAIIALAVWGGLASRKLHLVP